MRDRNSFVKAPRPASGADFGVAVMWRIGPGPVDIMTYFAPHDPVQANAGAREDQPLSLWAASDDVENGVIRQREVRVRGPGLRRRGRRARAPQAASGRGARGSRAPRRGRRSAQLRASALCTWDIRAGRPRLSCPRERPLWVCAVTRRRFPVGARPTRQSLQPEATGAAMQETNWLKPSVICRSELRHFIFEAAFLFSLILRY